MTGPVTRGRVLVVIDVGVVGRFDSVLQALRTAVETTGMTAGIHRLAISAPPEREAGPQD